MVIFKTLRQIGKNPLYSHHGAFVLITTKAGNLPGGSTCTKIKVDYQTSEQFASQPVQFEAIVAVNLTSFLVLTTMFTFVSDTLPKTAYLKLIDNW